MGNQQPWVKSSKLEWICLVLDSYAYWTNEQLLDRKGSVKEQSEKLFYAPFVIASHDNQADPIFNYGNQEALLLWEMDWHEFMKTPSRLTAEPTRQNERALMLSKAFEQGVIRNYKGIRISRTGRRFLIEQATVWNVIDRQKIICGQAVTFLTWTPITFP